jgi:predicted metal-dependent phosphoesterase TrpH
LRSLVSRDCPLRRWQGTCYGAGVLKVELHSHSADDPIDRIPHSTRELIDRAADLGYQALAITLHDRQLDLRPWLAHAQRRGVVLIPGIERTVHGKHILLLNFREGAEEVHCFDDIYALKQRDPGGLVIAPHPFFHAAPCLGGLLDRHADLFDAVEYNAMFTAALNFNLRAEQWARDHGKPIVGNGDVHRLRQLGTTFSLVEADATPDAICAAVRNGDVAVSARPLPARDAAVLMADLLTASTRARVARLFAGRPSATGLPDMQA